MAAKIEYKASVAKDLRKLDRAAALRILQKVEDTLAAEGHQGQALSGEFAGLYRLRVREYRVIYVRTDEGYLVLRIGHRRDVYRKGRPEPG
ncbi:MAG: type II toxin-antitoxin system RelE/ParE family toxin [Candidatus Rokubacteria bacterium]|nr:type II toxin-antitoxin system RelE/ParE family toxin [Candidatus Rokubacteria bacterium]